MKTAISSRVKVTGFLFLFLCLIFTGMVKEAMADTYIYFDPPDNTLLWQWFLDAPDGDGNVYYEYFNEPLNRIYRSRHFDGTTTYNVAYWGDTYTIKTQCIFDAGGNPIKDVHYHESGRIWKEIFSGGPDPDGNVYIEYFDEPLSRRYLTIHEDGSKIYTVAYWAGVDTQDVSACLTVPVLMFGMSIILNQGTGSAIINRLMLTVYISYGFLTTL